MLDSFDLTKENAETTIFKYSVNVVAEILKLGLDAADQIINEQKQKVKLREKLNILEYAENAKNKKNYYTPNEPEEDRLVDLIKLNDPDFNKEMFEHFAEDVFRRFQKAYCDKNFDSLRKNVDINILELFKVQAMKNADLKETIEVEDINYVDFFGYHKEGKLEVVSVALGTNYYDYIVDKEGKMVSGSDKIKSHSVYLLSFSRKIGGKTISNIKSDKDGAICCPNCGGKIINSFSECEFCHTILYNSTENWLLTHIEEM